jgi:alkylhydroperoxidase family enzyme
MRIDLPESQRDNPVPNLSRNYAKHIVDAAMNLSAITYQHSKLSLREFEAARARTAQINGCQICQAWRSARDLPSFMDAFGGEYGKSVATNGPAPDEAFYQSIVEWRSSSLYSERERLALEYAEGIGFDSKAIAADDAFWTRMRAAFSNDEIVDLSYCLGAWVGIGRITHALGLDGVCALSAPVSKDLAA